MLPITGRSRVLVLSSARGIPLYGPSGASAHLRGIARALEARGASVHLAVPRLEDHRGRVLDPVGVRVTTSPPRRWGWLPRSVRERGEVWDARRLVDQAVAEHGLPDLIWERHALFCDAGVRLATRHGIPRIVEVNAPLTRERARFEHLGDAERAERAERLEGETLRTADRVIAVSAWLARWAVDEMGCDAARVRHVTNGVEDLGPGDREATRARLGLTGPVVGLLGTNKPWHGVERLLDLADRLPETTLIVVGDGPVAVPIHPRIRALGRAAPAEVPHLVAAMDVGLAPYRADAPPWFCPLKVLAYRAQGVPVVAADIGDCRALVGDHGEIVTTDAPATWAAAVRRQLSAPRRPHTRSWRTVVEEALAG